MLSGASQSVSGLSEAALCSRLADLSAKRDLGFSKQLLEVGGFMSRSSRVGWGPNNTFYRQAFHSSDEGGMPPILKKFCQASQSVHSKAQKHVNSEGRSLNENRKSNHCHGLYMQSLRVCDV